MVAGLPVADGTEAGDGHASNLARLTSKKRPTVSTMMADGRLSSDLRLKASATLTGNGVPGARSCHHSSALRRA
jgi:hypothetical protein